jgi:hypothetical protein
MDTADLQVHGGATGVQSNAIESEQRSAGLSLRSRLAKARRQLSIVLGDPLVWASVPGRGDRQEFGD